jgi:hypothetical protein
MIPEDQIPQLQKLLKQQRRATWLIGIGLGLTVLGYICSRDPAFHAVSSPPAAVVSPASDMSDASDPSDARPSPAKFDLAADPEMGDDTFSFQLVQRRFANAYPEIEVVRLTREATHKTHLAGKYLPEAMSAMIHAPGKMNGWQTMICWIFMFRDPAGTGTVLDAAWACGIRIRPNAGSAFLSDATLPYIVWPSGDPTRAETGSVSLREAVNLCAPLYR